MAVGTVSVESMATLRRDLIWLIFCICSRRLVDVNEQSAVNDMSSALGIARDCRAGVMREVDAGAGAGAGAGADACACTDLRVS